MVPPDPSGSRSRDASRGRSLSVASMVESILGCKWSVRLLQAFAEGPRRPSALLRECPGLSAKVMNERLRKLTHFGILQRAVFGEKPPVVVEYRLSPFGFRFMKLLEEVRQLQETLDGLEAAKEGAGALEEG